MKCEKLKSEELKSKELKYKELKSRKMKSKDSWHLNNWNLKIVEIYKIEISRIKIQKDSRNELAESFVKSTWGMKKAQHDFWIFFRVGGKVEHNAFVFVFVFVFNWFRMEARPGHSVELRNTSLLK